MAAPNRSKMLRHFQWFDVRHRSLGMWAYVLNRITGLGLVVYLYLHLAVLSLLARGSGSWDSFLALARSPVFKAGESLLVAAVLVHGLNGVRIGLAGLGLGVKAHRAIFVGAMAVAVVASAAATVLIFGG